MFGSLQWALTLLTLTVLAAVSADRITGMNPCISKQTCHDCIQTPQCAWCSDSNFQDMRCFLPNINTKRNATCKDEFTWNPDHSYSVIRSASLTKGSYSAGGGGYEGYEYNMSSSGSSSSSSSSSGYFSGSASGSRRQEAVQIYPQEVNLTLRINDAHRISFTYAQAEDYPVDLYYLMDLSKSMEDDKKKLSALGQLLVEQMSKITSNFRLGFGSFVDKVVMPYVSVVPKSLEEPCSGCAKPYGYKNIMKLSENTSVFTDLVRDALVSGNLDAPEGGFDAIMQAIVCSDKIGWRPKARRLLVFSTDAGFHYAGDGKLGGIIKPNDGLCHLDSSGLYTHSSLQDYPSISQINHEVKNKAINIIWAVTEGQIHIYKSLTKHIEGSFAGKLSEDSSNIVELIREQYAAISSTLEIRNTASSSIKVKYFSSCLGGGPPIETSQCDGLKVGDKVEFFAEIKVTSCPKNRSEWEQTFTIYPVGISETLTVNLKMLCDCDCEQPTHFFYKEKADQCSGVGTLKCGACDCLDGYFGKNCECNSLTPLGGGVSTGNYSDTCRPDATSLHDCSGRGTCTCGQCQCTERQNKDELISGTYCECDNFSCDRHQGLLCSDHGTCHCGVCQCDKEWTGRSCNCPSTDQGCIAPGSKDGVVCSGHGDCECGECRCHTTNDFRYSGKFCDKCPSCPDHCEEFRNCVECQIYQTGNYSKEECDAKCTEFEAEPVDVIPNEGRDIDFICPYMYEEDCKFRFLYFYNETNQLIVRAQKQKECPPEIYMLGIVLGVIAAIVLIGLALLLLWKLLTTIHDRREFARFEKERMMAKWDTGENPIYKQATSTFKNPTYAGK